MRKSLNKYLIALSIVFFIGSLSGCSTTPSGGLRYGLVGSPAWHYRATERLQKRLEAASK